MRLVLESEFGNKRMSGYASSTFGRCSITSRVGSSRMRLSPGGGAARSSSRPKLRRSRREVTTTVSNNPDFIRRRDASCCKPMPRESIATSDATPRRCRWWSANFVKKTRANFALRVRPDRKVSQSASLRCGIESSIGYYGRVQLIANQFAVRKENQALRVAFRQCALVRHHHHRHP